MLNLMITITRARDAQLQDQESLKSGAIEKNLVMMINVNSKQRLAWRFDWLGEVDLANVVDLKAD